MRLSGAVRSYDIPLNGSANWTIRESMQLAILHPQQAYRFVQQAPDVEVGDALVAARDGTKLVSIHGDEATVFYFGVRAAPPVRFKSTMPAAPDDGVAEAIMKKSVCAFVCAPLTNPLNGKTVGPDREHVRAVVRVAGWKEKDAEFWVEEDYLPIQGGDVVADLHTWTERQAHAIGELGKSEWFAVIDKLDAGTPPPVRTEAPMLDRELTLSVNAWHGADRVEEVTPASQLPPPKRLTPTPASPPTAPPTTAPPPVPAISETPPPQKPPPVSNEQKPAVTLEMATPTIRRFIVAHFEKFNRGDWQSYVNDFSEPFEFYANGKWSRAKMRGSLPFIQPPGREVQKVVSDILLTPRGAGIFEARFEVERKTYEGARQASRDMSEQVLTVAVAADGARITNVQPGRGM